MKFGYVNVYQATFDLVVEGNLQQDSQPCESRLVVAKDFDEAAEMAREMRNDLRWGAVHKETLVRDVTLVHLNVMFARAWAKEE